jgi:hypothetical protein
MHDAALPDQKLFSEADNSEYQLPPDGIQEVEYYNDRIWVAGYGDGIRFSTVQNGDPLWWAFPATNEIHSEVGRVEMVATYRGTLYAGGPSGFGTVAGTSPFDFDIDWMPAKVGPVDAFAWSRVGGVLAFASTTGIFLFDGIAATRVDGPVRQLFAEQSSKPIVSASILILPTDEILVSLFHVNQNEYSTFLVDRQAGTWRKLPTPITQICSIENAGVHEVYYAWSGTKYVRRYWHGVEVNGLLDPLPTLDELTGPGSPTTEEIPYSFKSQRLDGGMANRLKHFKWLSVLPVSTLTNATVEVWIDGASVESNTYTVWRNTRNPFRIPIHRRGIDLQFELSGEGMAEIESMEIVGEL